MNLVVLAARLAVAPATAELICPELSGQLIYG
jgi:hypothetical protein